jgi:hypothetical protein
MNQEQKRELLDLLDEFGDNRYWVGRLAAAEAEGTEKYKYHQAAATVARNHIKELLFPVGATR